MLKAKGSHVHVIPMLWAQRSHLSLKWEHYRGHLPPRFQINRAQLKNTPQCSPAQEQAPGAGRWFPKENSWSALPHKHHT